ncbi:MAG: hypothetical protein WCT53_03655 [Candidatus Gracilibacteria bacterium]
MSTPESPRIEQEKLPDFSAAKEAETLRTLEPFELQESLSLYNDQELAQVLAALKGQQAGLEDKVDIAQTEIQRELELRGVEPELEIDEKTAEILKLSDELDAKLRAKDKREGKENYGDGTSVISIITPGAKQVLAVEWDHGTELMIYPSAELTRPAEGAMRLPVGSHAWKTGIKLYPVDFRQDIYLKGNPRELSYKRAKAYDNLIDFHFAGTGYSYGKKDLSKLFAAFGLQEDMDSRDKLKFILEVLNHQIK